MKKRISVDIKRGIIIDRTWEYAEPDPEVKVIFDDGYSVRFWVQGLTKEEYIKRAILIRQETE
jgi:hypothetical protein